MLAFRKTLIRALSQAENTDFDLALVPQFYDWRAETENLLRAIPNKFELCVKQIENKSQQYKQLDFEAEWYKIETKVGELYERVR